MNVFKSKIDKWLLFCLILSIIACLLGASVMLKIGGTFNYAFATTILIFGAGFPLWLLVSTRYSVNSENLKIVSGPFSWDIPIQSIMSVEESQNAVASPALSFDRLEIKYGEDKAIYVSPVDKAAFIQKLGSWKLNVADQGDQQRTGGKTSQSQKKKKQRKPIKQGGVNK
ncbi:MAG: PH domain-containing protein [Nitrosomonas sp.]|nr:PH domain-containing protein [Nitrosomonas sp.]